MKIIRKYANNKFYDYSTKKYATLKTIRDFLDEGERFQVLTLADEDITVRTIMNSLLKDDNVDVIIDVLINWRENE